MGKEALACSRDANAQPVVAPDPLRLAPPRLRGPANSAVRHRNYTSVPRFPPVLALAIAAMSGCSSEPVLPLKKPPLGNKEIVCP
jgi:hypothetical protein